MPIVYRQLARKMDKFIKILETKMKYFDEEINNCYNYCDELIEFCELPLDTSKMWVTREERLELKQIILKIETIKSNLYKINKENNIKN